MTIADLKIKLRETPRISMPRHVDIERLGKIADLFKGSFALDRSAPRSKPYVEVHPSWIAILSFHAKSTFAEPFISATGETAQEALDFLGERLAYEEELSPKARVVGAQVRRILAGE